MRGCSSLITARLLVAERDHVNAVAFHQCEERRLRASRYGTRALVHDRPPGLSLLLLLRRVELRQVVEHAHTTQRLLLAK